MYRRTFILLSLALVFLVPKGAAGADLTEGLVGYWPLDGNGDDASGNGNHGVVTGNVTPTTDRFGNQDSAMSFPGNTSAYIDLGQPPSLLIKGAMSVTAWVRAETLSQTGRIIAKQGPASARSWGLNLEVDGYARFDIGVNPTDRFRADSEPLTFGSNEWFHLAGVFRPGESVDLYVNGELVKSEATSLTTQWIENNLSINIGRRPQPGTPWNGDIDEVRMYNRSLSDEEVMSVMNQRALSFPKARGPNPEDGALHMSTWVNLSWLPGDSAVSHDVYLGESFDDVDAGTVDTFRGNQTEAFIVAGFAGFPYPNGLVEGTTYYWRIDEVNPADPNSPWKGDVWSFTVPSKIAYDPVPPNHAMYVVLNPTLTWTPGMGGALHHVYVGENLVDVEAGAGGTYKGPMGTLGYAAGPFEMDKVYYWRVDEFDGSVTNTGEVWSFRTVPDIPVSDPDLVGWWKLDEGHSSTAFDWSGHGNDGVLQGDAQWTDGYDSGAVKLSGSGSVYAESTQLPTSAFTVAFWFKSDTALNATDPRQDLIYWQNGNGRPHSTFNRSGDGEIGFWPSIGEDFDGPVTVTRAWAAGRWYHIAGTFDGSSFNIYVNGALEGSVLHPGVHADASGILIGARSGQQNYFTGDMDDVRLYSKALTAEEIGLAMRSDPLVAWSPSPGNGTTPYVKDATALTWSPGEKAAEHEVYFGMDRGAVENADATDVTGVYRGSRNSTSFTPPEGVEWGGGPYYWRVDQNNTDGTTTKGGIWSFSVADFITVDDFESYDDIDPAPGEPGVNRIFDIWIDGFGTTANGALVGNDLPPYAEQTVVHDGAQSLIYRYDNNMKTSEATLTLVDRKDWTEEGVTKLLLWFRGLSANSPERMYVALNGNAVVYHPEPAATQKGVWTWTEWVIDLQEFANQGVDLANVNTITIGVGTKNPGAPGPGGTGMMYFDDIQLNRPVAETQ
ncbi:MAG: LamG domain-containing protein [Phycisphaerae bacterium]|nr:LamG domain-containing protein [Phycisphaerae bacterium]